MFLFGPKQQRTTTANTDVLLTKEDVLQKMLDINEENVRLKRFVEELHLMISTGNPRSLCVAGMGRSYFMLSGSVRVLISVNKCYNKTFEILEGIDRSRMDDIEYLKGLLKSIEEAIKPNNLPNESR